MGELSAVESELVDNELGRAKHVAASRRGESFIVDVIADVDEENDQGQNLADGGREEQWASKHETGAAEEDSSILHGVLRIHFE